MTKQIEQKVIGEDEKNMFDFVRKKHESWSKLSKIMEFLIMVDIFKYSPSNWKLTVKADLKIYELIICFWFVFFFLALFFFFVFFSFIGLVGRVFTNGLVDIRSIPRRVIAKTLKMLLDTSLLNTQQYKARIKGKVEQSRKRSSALSYTPVL